MKINDTEFNCKLDEILDALDIFQNRKDSGDNIMVCCPYHNERRPSAGIRKRDGIFHCFACNEVHTLPEVISHVFGKDDMGVYGWQWLLKNFLTISIEERKDIPLDLDRKALYNVNKDREYVREEELAKYRYVHPYMYERGLTDEIIEMFDIGYDMDTNCITFPIRDDINGKVLFVARRSVKTKYFNYPKNVEKPLYGLYEYYDQMAMSVGFIDKDPTGIMHDVAMRLLEVVVCESMFDALSFWTIGKPAVALNGLGNELQFKQLRGLPCRELILCTDMDKAGMRARKRIREKVTNKIITEYMLPEGRKDANECTKDELRNLRKVM